MMEKIIWLTGMPRSGTTWISQIFASNPDVRVKFCPLFSYAFKNALNETATREQWREFFAEVFVTRDAYMDQDHLRQNDLVPKFAKNPDPKILLIKSNRFHNLTESILQKCPEVTFISIVRHPCAVIYSWLSNPLEFPPDQNPKTQWQSGACRKSGSGEFWGFDDWKKVTSLHLKFAEKQPQNFFIERYEDFKRNPLERTRKLFQKLNIPITTETTGFLRSTHSRHDDHRRSVYKDPAKLSDWKTGLDSEIAAKIHEELVHTELSVFLKE